MSHISKIIIASELELLSYIRATIEEITQSKSTSKEKINEFSELDKYATKVNLALISAAKDRKYINLEQIKPIFHFAYQKPSLAKESIAVIWQAENLNSQAQNRLLKIIEEPPTYLNFYLCVTSSSGLENILPTIKSRCEVINIATDSSTIDTKNAELIEKLSQASNDLFSASRTAKSGYKNLNQIIEGIKVSQQKREVWSEFTKIVNSLQQQKLSNREIEHAKILGEICDAIKAGIKHNLNQKLLIDNLFVKVIEYHKL